MTWLRPLLAVALLGPLPVFSQGLAGVDDPAYVAVMARLLQADDPSAITALHDLANNGNTAALVALPVAESWFPVGDALQDRLALRQIDGAWVTELAAAAYKPAALWQGGAISPTMRDQLNRALWLYELGEDRKGDALLQGWFNHMPEAAPLPEGFADLPAAAWLKAMILEQHVVRGDRKALPVLQYWLDQDRIEGWMVLASVGDHYDGQGQPMISGLRLGANTGARLNDGRKVRRLLWQEEPPAPVPPETVQIIVADLMPRPQFAPVRAYCETHCAGSTPACEAAYVTIFGQPYLTVTPQTPWGSLLSDDAFFGSPRGEQVLLATALIHRLGMDRADGYHGALADNPAWPAANKLDACFAAGAVRALRPLP